MSRVVRPKVERGRVGIWLSLAIALGIFAATAWLALLPVRTPARRSPVAPRPDFLDKPHRHRAR